MSDDQMIVENMTTLGSVGTKQCLLDFVHVFNDGQLKRLGVPQAVLDRCGFEFARDVRDPTIQNSFLLFYTWIRRAIYTRKILFIKDYSSSKTLSILLEIAAKQQCHHTYGSGPLSDNTSASTGLKTIKHVTRKRRKQKPMQQPSAVCDSDSTESEQTPPIIPTSNQQHLGVQRKRKISDQRDSDAVHKRTQTENTGSDLELHPGPDDLLPSPEPSGTTSDVPVEDTESLTVLNKIAPLDKIPSCNEIAQKLYGDDVTQSALMWATISHHCVCVACKSAIAELGVEGFSASSILWIDGIDPTDRNIDKIFDKVTTCTR